MKFRLSLLLFMSIIMQWPAFAQLENAEVVDGLKEALTLSTKLAVKSASKHDGFNGNQLIHIPFPPEAEKMETTLRQAGMGAQVDDFIVKLNRAAEDASKAAIDIFIEAIKDMDVNDGIAILNGGNEAATTFMYTQTQPQCYEKFKPIVVATLQTMKVTDYWDNLAKAYNKIPLTPKVNPDLEDYTTNRCINGLFKLMAQEEKKIRTLGTAQVTETLKKVFGR